jgi:hypothetical protein
VEKPPAFHNMPDFLYAFRLYLNRHHQLSCQAMKKTKQTKKILDKDKKIGNSNIYS